MEKNKKKDIFDDILGGSEEDSIPGMEDLAELLYRRGQPSTKASTKKSVRALKQKRKGKRPAKKKVTYYIPENIFVELSEAKAKIKVMVPPELKSRVSMSRIVELALSPILQELGIKGQKSSLVKNILTKTQKK